MDRALIYGYILSRVNEDLVKYGYKRSGKSKLFYRYFEDGKITCAVEMEKSAFNTEDCCRFTFNAGCIALYNLSGYPKNKLTLETVKLALTTQAGVIRIGHLTDRGDYWWEIDEEILNHVSLEEYYNRYLHDDIIKCACYLDELALKKAWVYKK